MLELATSSGSSCNAQYMTADLSLDWYRHSGCLVFVLWSQQGEKADFVHSLAVAWRSMAGAHLDRACTVVSASVAGLPRGDALSAMFS